MTLHFVDRLPVLGYREIEGYDLAFAWVWDQPCLRVTFTGNGPTLTGRATRLGECATDLDSRATRLIGRVTHLDGLPRLVAAPDNLDWLQQDDPARTLTVLDFAADLWRRKDRIFRTCNG